MNTISDALTIAQNKIGAQEGRWLLQHITQKKFADLIANFQQELSATEKNDLHEALDKRAKKIPLAYILKNTPFCGREFYVDENVLVPREDSETLVNNVIICAKENNSSNLNILELGVGSGALIITIAKKLGKSFNYFASDVTQGALQVAQKNFITHLKPQNINVKCFCGSWFEPFNDLQIKFNVIYSNPPYIAADDKHLQEDGLLAEPKIALTDNADGTTCIRHLIKNAKSLLCDNGYLAIEHGFEQGDIARNLFTENSYQEVATICDDNDCERITIGKNKQES